MKRVFAITIICCMLLCTAVSAELQVTVPETVKTGEKLVVDAYDQDGGYECIHVYRIRDDGDGLYIGSGAGTYGTGKLTIIQTICEKPGSTIELFIVATPTTELRLDLPWGDQSAFKESFEGCAHVTRYVSVI